MINSLPKSLIETANTILVENKFLLIGYKNFSESFYFDNIIDSLLVEVEFIAESFDSDMNLHDVTHIAQKEDPERFAEYKKSGIKHVKVEYDPDSNEVIHTLYRDGAWEIHHQKGDTVGEIINSGKPALKFIGKMYSFIKEKVDAGDKVRLSGTPEMVEKYHTIAKKIVNMHGNSSLTDIENGIDFHRIGKPVKEFYIYPKTMDECKLPLFFKTIHESMRFAKKHFPNSPQLLEYENNLRKQGHPI